MHSRAFVSVIGRLPLLLVAAAFALDLSGRLAVAGERTADISPEVVLRHGLLTVHATDMPLAELLRAIGAKAGFRVIIKGDLRDPVTWSFTEAPVDKALRRLLHNTSSVLIYAPARDGGTGPLVEVIALRTMADAAPRTAQIARTIRARKTEVSRGTPVVSLTDDREVRLRAVRRLANNPDAAATNDLALLLSEDEDPLIRRITAIALGKIGGAQAEAALTVALEDGDALVRSRAIRALARKRGHKAVETLAKALMDDPEPTIRRQAALSLGRIFSEEAYQVLDAARFDTDLSVRRAVLAGLARLEDM